MQNPHQTLADMKCPILAVYQILILPRYTTQYDYLYIILASCCILTSVIFVLITVPWKKRRALIDRWTAYVHTSLQVFCSVFHQLRRHYICCPYIVCRPSRLLTFRGKQRNLPDFETISTLLKGKAKQYFDAAAEVVGDGPQNCVGFL